MKSLDTDRPNKNPQIKGINDTNIAIVIKAPTHWGELSAQTYSIFGSSVVCIFIYLDQGLIDKVP